MYLSKIRIQNFKVFEDVTIMFNSDLNVLTGANNSGKSTVLEAISLWNSCFYRLINRVDRAIKSKEQTLASPGDYKLGYVTGRSIYAPQSASKSYFEKKDIIAVRSASHEDIHYWGNTRNRIMITATFRNHRENVPDLDIPFTIEAQAGGNYAISFPIAKDYDYRAFNSFFEQLPNPFNVIYASPIALLRGQESYKTVPQIKERVAAQSSFLVLRNRLWRLFFRSQVNIKEDFLKDLALVLNNNTFEIDIKFDSDVSVHSLVSCKINTNRNGYLTEISLVGSGTLQIIEILLAIYEDKYELNLVLLDEPDSHIHRDIQKRLISYLTTRSLGNQLIVTTHNESLIRITRPEHLFHLAGNEQSSYQPIVSQAVDSRKVGWQPTQRIKILESLGNESGYDLLNAIEADAVVLVEGKNDALYIQKIIDLKYRNFKFSNLMYWAFDGVNSIFKELAHYKKLFQSLKNKSSVWGKSVLVFDRDYLTDSERNNLQTAIQLTGNNDMGIPTYIWNAYTIEATILTDQSQLERLLFRFFQQKASQKGFTLPELSVVLQEEITTLVDNLSQRITMVANDGSLYNQRINMKNNIALATHETVFDGELGRLVPNYTNEINDKLLRYDIASFAKKEDVHQLVANTFTRLTNQEMFADNINKYFLDLLSCAEPPIWFHEWDNVVRLIEQRL